MRTNISNSVFGFTLFGDFLLMVTLYEKEEPSLEIPIESEVIIENSVIHSGHVFSGDTRTKFHVRSSIFFVHDDISKIHMLLKNNSARGDTNIILENCIIKTTSGKEMFIRDSKVYK